MSKKVKSKVKYGDTIFTKKVTVYKDDGDQYDRTVYIDDVRGEYIIVNGIPFYNFTKWSHCRFEFWLA